MDRKISLCAFADEADNSLDGQISALRENDIKLLEIRGLDGVNISEIDGRKAVETKKKLDFNGLSVWSIGSPIGKIGINDNFEAHLESFKKLLFSADILGAKAFRLFSFYTPNDKNSNDYSEIVFERLNSFCAAAENSDVILCHENEKGIFGDTADRCEKIHKSLPKLKAVFDPANFVQCGEDTLKAFDKLKNYIFYMHIKDSKKDGEIVPPGDGIGNIKQLVNLYKGEVFTLEPHLYGFSGLDKLEKDGERSEVGGYNFKNGREAFNFAADRFKNILKGENLL